MLVVLWMLTLWVSICPNTSLTFDYIIIAIHSNRCSLCFFFINSFILSLCANAVVWQQISGCPARFNCLCGSLEGINVLVGALLTVSIQREKVHFVCESQFNLLSLTGYRLDVPSKVTACFLHVLHSMEKVLKLISQWNLSFWKIDVHHNSISHAVCNGNQTGNMILQLVWSIDEQCLSVLIVCNQYILWKCHMVSLLEPFRHKYMRTDWFITYASGALFTETDHTRRSAQARSLASLERLAH